MSQSKNQPEQPLPPAHDVPAWLALALLSAACFCLILAPTRLVPILTKMAAERRMYLPLAALVALVVIGYSLLTRLAANANARRPAGCPRRSPSSKKRSNCGLISPRPAKI